MMSRLLVVTLLVLTAFAADKKTVRSPYKAWLTEDVAYIITDVERREFQALTTGAKRDEFIEQFWLRRSRDP